MILSGLFTRIIYACLDKMEYCAKVKCPPFLHEKDIWYFVFMYSSRTQNDKKTFVTILVWHVSCKLLQFCENFP